MSASISAHRPYPPRTNRGGSMTVNPAGLAVSPSLWLCPKPFGGPSR